MTVQDQGRMQEDRLDRLLALAGPVDAAELLSRLGDDLARVEVALAAAVACKDCAEVRAETHILIAVAGSVGAVGLAEDARALNLAAQDGGGVFAPSLVQDIARDLSALQALIAAKAAG